MTNRQEVVKQMVKNILHPKKTKKKTNKLKTQIKQMIKTAEKIKSDKLLLTHINPQLLTSLDFVIKELSFQIDERLYSQSVDTQKYIQYNIFITALMKLETKQKNATLGYNATRNNFYLNTIIALKSIITNLKLAYATELKNDGTE